MKKSLRPCSAPKASLWGWHPQRAPVIDVAILAWAMGVPTVMGLVDIPVNQLDGRELIVDGFEGQIFACPRRICGPSTSYLR